MHRPCKQREVAKKVTEDFDFVLLDKPFTWSSNKAILKLTPKVMLFFFFLPSFFSSKTNYIKNKDKYRLSNKNTYGPNTEWGAAYL